MVVYPDLLGTPSFKEESHTQLSYFDASKSLFIVASKSDHHNRHYVQLLLSYIFMGKIGGQFEGFIMIFGPD